MMVTLPPPMHGSNRVNQLVVENSELHSLFSIRVLRLNYVESISDIGRFQIKKYGLFIFYWFRLLAMLFVFRPDFVYFVPCVSGAPFFRDCAYIFLLRMFRVKIILHLHAKGVADRVSKPCFRLMYRFFFKNTWVLALSPSLYGDICAFVPEYRVRYIPNGTDFKIDQKRSFTVIDNVKFIFLSNLVVTKGPLTLLDACYILKKNGLRFTVFFVGNPTKELDQRSITGKIYQYGLENEVFYLGPKYVLEKHDILCNSDVLVFPTYRDCFPLVLLEAMAFAMPVISTHEGAIPEIVDDGQTGLLVPGQDAPALAAAMAKFIEHPHLIETYGLKGQEKFTDNYTMKTFQQNITKIFIEIILNEPDFLNNRRGETE